MRLDCATANDPSPAAISPPPPYISGMNRFAWLALPLLVPAFSAQAGEIVLSNAALELRLDDTTGAVRQLRNVAKGLDLVTNQDGQPAFVVQTSTGAASAVSFTATPVAAFDGAAFDLHWNTDKAGIGFDVRIELPTNADDIRMFPRVTNSTPDLRVYSMEYPILGGIQRLVPAGGTDYELLSAAQGYLYREPYTNLPVETRRWLYPDGYGGASTQLWAYFRKDVGGFSMEVRDATGVAKNFMFNKESSTGDLRWSVETLTWDKSAGHGLDPAFDIRLVALTKGDWEEAADHYRAWSLQQAWASKGRVANRLDSQFPRWLYEQTYATTFGVSINLDQAKWYRALHDWVGGPLFHISGFWWPGGTAQSEWYGGYNDWNDARVNVANLTAIQQKGDRWGLFLFDLHFADGAHEWASSSPDPLTDPVAPWQPYNMSPDPEDAPWNYVCPATSVWPAFHGWRDLKTFDNYGYDANYYDIGAGLGRVRCENTAHGHPAGRGRWMIDGYRTMLNARRDELHTHAGHYIPAGTELISELYLREFDYYQARAEASVMSMLEGDHFRAGEKAGWKEKVPLFAYAYHDVGPVRLDGNLKAAAKFGEIFYWIAARTVAWGGLPELNYELSALEKFPGMTDTFTWYETYKDTFHVIDNSPYASAADRGLFLGRLGKARTGFAKPWLAYGRMTRAPRVVSGLSNVTVDWHLYNTFNRATDTTSGIERGAEYYEQGTLAINPLVTSAFTDEAAPASASVGLFFVNVTSTAQSVTIQTDPSRHGLSYLNYARTRLEDGVTQELGVQSGTQDLTLSLPSRAPVVIRLRPSECTGATCLYRVYRADTGSAASQAAATLAAFQTTQGHSWDDASLNDGVSRFYLIDDGGGFPSTVTVSKTATVLQIQW